VFAHFAVDNIKGKHLKDVINSPLFQCIKAKQPFNKDHRMPCMIIDNPDILRSVVRETGAHPTHPGAETLINELAPALDEYAEGLRRHIRKEDQAKKTMASAA
jgi:hypothetical protein